MNEGQIARISRYLNQAERVITCGKGSSDLAAREMELRFMRIGVDIDSLVESDLIRMQAVFLDKRSLVFALSISGEKEDILYLLQEAHTRGARTVLITANNNHNYNKFCDEALLIPSLKHLNHGKLISPQFPILVMVDIIYSYYVEQDKYQKEILLFGGTDTSSMQLAGAGAAVGAVSIPTRYIHSGNEMCDLADAQSCAALVSEYVKKIG